MGQPGFFDLSRRYEGLDAKNDPLVAILAAVPFELFRPQLKAALVAGGLRTADAHRKSAAGRKPWDEVGTSINLSLADCGHCERRFDSGSFPF